MLSDSLVDLVPGLDSFERGTRAEYLVVVEATRRGPYTGSIGVIGFDDRATFNMTIRTLVHHEDHWCPTGYHHRRLW